MKRGFVSTLAAVLLVLSVVPMVQAGDSATIIGLDSVKGIVTVKHNTTGVVREVQIGDPKLMSDLTVGQIIDPPMDADVQSRAATKPPMKSTKNSGCLERCIHGGSTTAQCVYYCGFVQ